MADAIALYFAALLLMAGAVAVGVIVRRGRRRAALERQQEPERLRRELRDLDSYIDRVRAAQSEAELDGLESNRNGDT